MDVNVYLHDGREESLARIQRSLDRIERMLTQLQRMEIHEMALLDDLTSQVQANHDLEESAVTMIQGLADQIAATAGDPAAVAALADSLRSSATDLGAAITANTPAAPPA